MGGSDATNGEWPPRDEASEPPGCLEDFLPIVYEELRRLAGHYLRRERPDHTLQSTALVHEAYLRLAGRSGAGWANRKVFFCAAAKAMRRILLNHARDHRRLKRGGGKRKISLEEGAIPISADRAADLEALDEAIEALAAEDPRKAQTVELRYFGGLSVEETAEALGVSPASVKRYWSFAKAWLLRRLSEGLSDEA